MLALLVSAFFAVSVQDHLSGAEVGDATWAVSFRTGGRYRAEWNGKPATVAQGRWSVKGNRLEVKVASCKGPECARLGKSYGADVTVFGPNAMTVRSEPADAVFPTGSYYCLYQGCEKRLGVEVVGQAPREVLERVEAHLSERDASREKLAVWLSPSDPAAIRTALVVCPRDPERAKRALALVKSDLALLPSLGAITVEQGPKDCLYEVRVVLGANVRLG